MFDRPSLSASAARNIISWPLEKYSYAKPDPAAIQAPPADLQWTHLPHRDNLFIVFETYHIGTSDFNHRLREAVRVKVTYGYEILQDLDLSELGMKTVFSEGKTQAGALVLGKSPCLAVKYTRNGDRQCSRFQVRFRRAEDWDVATKKLEEYGLHVKPPPPAEPKNNSQPSQPGSSQLRQELSQYHHPPEVLHESRLEDSRSYGMQSARAATMSYPSQHVPLQNPLGPGIHHQPVQQWQQPVQNYHPANLGFSQISHSQKQLLSHSTASMSHPAAPHAAPQLWTQTMSPPPSSHGALPTDQHRGTLDHDPIIVDDLEVPPVRNLGLIFGTSSKRTSKPATKTVRPWDDIAPRIQPTFLPKPSEKSSDSSSLGEPKSASTTPKPITAAKKAAPKNTLSSKVLAKQRFEALAMGLPSPDQSPLKKRRRLDIENSPSSPTAVVHSRTKQTSPGPPPASSVIDDDLSDRDADGESVDESTADEKDLPPQPLLAPNSVAVPDSASVPSPPTRVQKPPTPELKLELEPKSEEEEVVGEGIDSDEEIDIGKMIAEALVDDSFVELCEKIKREWKEIGFSGWDGIEDMALKETTKKPPAHRKRVIKNPAVSTASAAGGVNGDGSGGSGNLNQSSHMLVLPVQMGKEKPSVSSTVMGTVAMAKQIAKKDKGKGKLKVKK